MFCLPAADAAVQALNDISILFFMCYELLYPPFSQGERNMTQKPRFYAALILLICVIAGVACLFSCGKKFDGPAYLNPNLSVEKRVNDLVGRMTLSQKASQMINSAAAIDTLGIPPYDWWNEALHGVCDAGIATVFPQAIGNAAMWDDNQLFEMASVISDEARAKYYEAIRQNNHRGRYGLTFWSPNINLFRDPRWGRGQETYGEDPFLTGRMAVAFVKGMQGDNPRYLKTVSTLKHYAVHSGPEPMRHTFDAQPTDRDLYESYLPHFKDGIVEGGAYSVMGAYNRVRGESASAQSLLLDKILRKTWGFKGYIVGDCGAVQDIYANHKIVATPQEAAALAIKRGLDLDCGSVFFSNRVDNISLAVQESLLTEADVDVAVKRLMTARMKLGMFDPPEMVPWSNMPFSVNNAPEHARLAEQIARKTMVLLKNENNTLPFSKDLKTIAVIGPNAAETQVLHGNYSGTASNPISALKGIQDKVGGSMQVLYARGCEIAPGQTSYDAVPDSFFSTTVAGKKQTGLAIEYFGTLDYTGAVVKKDVVPSPTLSFTEQPPAEGLVDNQYSIRLSGNIVVPQTGQYIFRGGAGGGRGGFGGGAIITVNKQQFGTAGGGRGGFGGGFGGFGGAAAAPQTVTLQAGKSYPITIQAADTRGNLNVGISYAMLNRDYASEAVAIASKADAVVLVMGINSRLEGEEMRGMQVEGFSGGDRTEIALPKNQDELIQKIAAVGKPTVVVLMNGSALAVNTANDLIPAILEAWYPGEGGGVAIADVLFGDYNPAGRLPVTFYKSVADLPDFTDYNMANRTYKYFTGTPLYPFGFGLSYTTFEYSGLTLPKSVKAGKPVELSVTVKNTGSRDGDEVVQVYVTDSKASFPIPIRRLAAFKRITLKAGESQVVTLTIQPREMSVITDVPSRIVEPGEFQVSVGGKQPGFTGSADATTTGVVGGVFTATGKAANLEL
jgi:beta-glucosidase